MMLARSGRASAAVAVMCGAVRCGAQLRGGAAALAPAGRGPAAAAAATRRWASAEARSAAGRTKLGFDKLRRVVAYGRGKREGKIVADPARCGEDSYFTSDELMPYVGVADGVGGWRSEGIDPGEIARQLMANCKRLADSKFCPPQFLLAEAYYKVKYGKEVDAGSTTACIAALAQVDNDGAQASVLYIVNVGDSGFILIRDREIAQSTDFRTSLWEAPAQLAVIPAALQRRGFIETEPWQGKTDGFEVQKGDLLVMGTDGLWDNVTPDEVLMMSGKFEDEDALCYKLVEAASTNPRKPDDVTVVVARV